MKFWPKIKSTLVFGCVLYTVFITGAYLVGLSVYPENLGTLQSVVFGLLGFSFFLALSFLFLFSDLLNAPLRIVLHFAVSMLVFYFILLRGSSYVRDGGSIPKMLLVFALLYLIVGAVVYLVRRLTSSAEKKQKPEDYEDIFSSKNAGRGTSAPNTKGGRRP
ncbi:MAG: hypothetical protein IKQ92_11620 [Clostridia bacterium]|nr:hypothetical protein [Clostridia bacterium]